MKTCGNCAHGWPILSNATGEPNGFIGCTLQQKWVWHAPNIGCSLNPVQWFPMPRKVEAPA